MTFLQAEQFIESKAAELKLTQNGEPLDGMWSVILIAKHFNQESEALWSGIEKSEITIEQYVQGWLDLIQQMAEHVYILRLEKKLSGL